MSNRDTEREVDVLVVGGGVAGLSTALALASTRRVLLVDAAPQGDGGSTRWAQGGIAAAVDAADDPADHEHVDLALEAAVCGAHSPPPGVPMLIIRSTARRARAATSSGTVTSSRPSRRARSSSSGVVIFM